MATLDFPSYCGAADVSPAVTSFCLFQISQDLSTAVTVTRQNQALAVDLNDYFRCAHVITTSSFWFGLKVDTCNIFCEIFTFFSI